MPKIGLKKAFYALIASDTEGNITYDNPVSLPHLQKINVSPRVNTSKVTGDDLTLDDIAECLGADMTVQRDEFLPSEEVIILGRSEDETGGVYGGNFDDPPYVAFGYMRTFKNSNMGLYVWILKTRFAPSNMDAETKAPEGLNPQFDTYSASSITREADGAWIYSIKSSDPSFADTFFTKTTLEKLRTAVAMDPIALDSIAPADGAVDVAVSDDVVLTFNNKVAAEAATVIKDDGTQVATTKSWDANGKILTVKPDVDLDATSTYIVAVNGVKDIKGQILDSVAKSFTTA